MKLDFFKNLKTIIFAITILNIFSFATYGFHLEKSQTTIQLGGTVNTGNSETTNISSAITNDMEYGNWQYGSDVSGQLATSKGIESARSLKSNANLNYAFSEHFYWFIKGSILYDKFSTYDFIIREISGLGRTLIKNKLQLLTLETGPGLIHRRISGVNEFQHEAILNISGKYILHLNDHAEFKQTFTTDVARLNTHLEATSAIRTKIIKNLALELSFTINHDTTIPPLSNNPRKTDTASKVTIVYSF